MNHIAPVLLAPAIHAFEAAGRQLSHDGSWSCETGALALSFLLKRQGIEHTLQVGSFIWPQKHLREKYERMEGPNPTRAELKEYWAQEHHHWVLVTDKRLDEPWVIDPNGELHHSGRVLPASEAKRYEHDDRERKWSGIGPGSDPEVEAQHWPTLARALEIFKGEAVASLPKDDAVLNDPAPTVARGY